MPSFYCQNCGAKHTYSGKKPTACSKCKTGVEVIAYSPKSPTPVTPKAPTKASVREDREELRRKELWLARRGRQSDPTEETDSEEDEEFEDENFSIPTKLKFKLEADGGLISSARQTFTMEEILQSGKDDE